MARKLVNTSCEGGLPAPNQISAGGFVRKVTPANVELFLLPDAIEYEGAVDPVKWKSIGYVRSPRTREVGSEHNGRPVSLMVRRDRSKNDETRTSFSDLFPEVGVRERVQKAAFIHKHLVYDDENLTVRAEKPVGYVRYPDGLEEEVYLKDVGVVKIGELGGNDRDDAKAAVKKYNAIKGNLRGCMFMDYDLNEEEDNLLFGRRSDGGIVLVKIDTEYTRVVDLGELAAKVRKVDEMLESVGFDPGEYDNLPVYSSISGHNVAERLLDACRLMDGKKEAEFLSADNAGALVKAVEAHSERAAKDQSMVKTAFMGALSNVLTACAEIVPAQRTRFATEMTALLAETSSERELFKEQGKIEARFKRIKPIGGEKDDMRW